jgi:hypothetical protein
MDSYLINPACPVEFTSASGAYSSGACPVKYFEEMERSEFN